MDAGIVDRHFTKEAISSLHKLLETMQDKNGDLYHQTLLPNKPTQKGLLEDYAFVADALFSAYQATFDDVYLKQFRNIVNLSVNKFYTGEKWVQSENRDLLVKATIDESSYKSALATNLQNIIKAVAFGNDYKLLDIVNSTIKQNAILINKAPYIYPTSLDVVTMYKRGVFVIKGPKLGLIKVNLDDIKYPFVYKKGETAKTFKEYQVCGLKSCYLTDISIVNVKNRLKELLNGK